MIFILKHRWWTALLATILGAAAAWWLGAWDQGPTARLSWPAQVAVGLAGGCGALFLNLLFHETFKRTVGRRYVDAFERHSRAVLGPMGWREYLAGGLMAAAAEEPLFRGLLLQAFENPAVGVAVAAIVFAGFHWLSVRFFPFWIWAAWEGVVFGVLLVATGSLLVPAVAHGVHDVVAYRALRALVRFPRSDKLPACRLL